ncbi:hypothetical protein MCOR27_009995 [Pyricularia oryzae]|uniref:non-specific serine/threonine protein kinase n=1 Tax=Pyricularia grisea TaxID=148305 RepID=A0ABQ8NFJ0_PYRGI|nr:hypothetical protein MCOR19_011000 [Pyricularia oryzae]KAI6295303.1 hypothetical protein MCOR33_007751 [Pyricularia grisea]KAI6268841.1 hypothetical protein MCOR27_009995 [Pyricularia oryzae]KAI6323991.1 hypothetical protein MCOR30_007210 [Pyricularia oryzae]KAI6352539.1 hypothetical protein MCOR32_011246 [Pyricularia oryzae]
MEVRPQARVPPRPVLEEASMRTNYSKSQNSATPPNYQHGGLKTENVRPAQPQKTRRDIPVSSSHVPLNPRLYEIREEAQSTPQSKRESQASTASYKSSSSNTFRKPKTHVGPWQLGKTLGKGSSARVRLARHTSTHQYVAVKIVAKSTCKMTQAGSLAKLDEIDSAAPEKVEGMRRMPIALEREVAILKLIEHPNIVKLYDIWENSNEIYLILEYVERGDLFDFISKHGPMPEEEAIFVFRQIMSALEYCHSYGICHRDLKPENILLKSNGQVKIADFGMAALHQGPRTPLWTFCGSPHYAAPELLREKAYRGEKSDIWSMGVILFAMMAARLPFDDEDMNLMFAKARKAIYHMPSFFSDEAKDLIHRLLQVDPRKRLSMRQMWQHPVVWKYGYLDELGGEGIPEVPNPRTRQEIKPLDLCDIDPQILRPIQSMWHTLSEDELVKKLISDDPNDQKLFYWLLNSYRERQLENYDPSLTHSPSDYHHIRPPLWLTKVSTRQFMTNKASGQGRSISKFTVISNVTETGTGANLGTVRSYDPYKSPAVKQPQATHARIVIHRDSTDTDRNAASLRSTSHRRPRANSTGSWKRPARRSQLGSRILTPRSTASSVQSSRKFHVRSRTGSRQKRAMDFSTARRKAAAAKLSNQQTLLGTDGSKTVTEWNIQCSSDPGIPGDTADRSNARLRSKDRLHEELRHFSSSIAKDCDEAFNSSLLSVSQFDGDRSRQGSPFSLSLGTPVSATPVTPVVTPAIPRPSARPWDSRPLPPTPPSSSHEKESAINFGENPSILARRGQPPTQGYNLRSGPVAMTPTPSDRRVVSAPVHGGQYGGCATGKLPSIEEATPNTIQDEVNRSRIVSLPAKPAATAPTSNEARGLEFLSNADQTIRIVHSPSAQRESGITRRPHPIQANAKPSKMVGTSTGPVKQASIDLYHADDSIISHRNAQLAQTSSHGSASTFAMRKKTSSWFKRLSRESKGSKGSLCDELDDTKSIDVPHGLTSGPIKNERDNSSINMSHRPPEKTSNKKKSFFLPFWRHKSEPRMSLAEPDFEESPSPETNAAVKSHKTSGNNLLNFGDAESAERMIKPQQNWLARLFRVKPATRVICLSISRRRARQEVAILLRDWRKYGIRDVEVDKKRNVIFARLSSKNHLNIKEVALACEIITVIEHGKRNHLSIVRFTQEKGAASSFQRVVDTMRDVLGNRNLLVTDKSKAKMMIKTLNS